ncbi:nucleotidyltransferase family protein, partial [Paenibacillus dendritiformis]
TIASATAVRRLWSGSGDLAAAARYVPESTLRILEREHASGRAPLDWEAFRRELFYRLYLLPPEDLARYLEVTEGLEHRIKQALQTLEEPGVEPLIAKLKTKRYTRTKLMRTLAHILLHHDKFHFGPDALGAGPAYVRVLGFTERGRHLLKRMKRCAELPVVLNMTRDNSRLGGRAGLEADARATAVYANAFRGWEARAAFRDYYEPPRRF